MSVNCNDKSLKLGYIFSFTNTKGNTMATKKAPVNSKLLEAVTATPPQNPALTGPDRVFLRGLKRRGYTEFEIIAIGKKAGMTVTADDLKPKKKAASVQQVKPANLTR
jgi:hypothetical protein